MSDMYSELLVPRRSVRSEQAIRIALIVVTAIVTAAGLVFNMYLLIGALALGIVDFFLFPRFNVEYEYQYMIGEINIDKILSKSKR